MKELFLFFIRKFSYISITQALELELEQQTEYVKNKQHYSIWVDHKNIKYNVIGSLIPKKELKPQLNDEIIYEDSGFIIISQVIDIDTDGSYAVCGEWGGKLWVYGDHTSYGRINIIGKIKY
jgi:hypothetical protein